ncbi:MAG: RluA family pseudouridine synthase [Victivallaceae bacterium]|nr:RluA family pseudouridine synthase [Victivallaceae bacterium]
MIKEHIITDDIAEQRFLDYSIAVFAEFITAKKGVKKAIKRGELLLNGAMVESGRYLKKGDKLQLFDLDNRVPKTFNLKLEIVYEDDCLAVINKPAGIVVSGNQYRTIVNALQFNLAPSSSKDALNWAKPVHRLDHQTSGLLLVAKTHSAIVELSRQFEHKEITKKYHAVVIGKPDATGLIEYEIEGRTAITEYKRLASVKSLRNDDLSLLELTPHTGRTHQLRIHLSQLGFPIMGDRLYGTPGEILKNKGLFLSAVELHFKHPDDGQEMDVRITAPDKFKALLNREQRRFDKTN